MKKASLVNVLAVSLTLSLYGVVVMPHVSGPLAEAVLSMSGRAHAQSPTNGPCNDPWLNELIPGVKASLGKPSNVDGAANQGECNILNYGGGRWAGKDDLKAKIQVSFQSQRPGVCRDGWVSDSIRRVYGRAPHGTGETGECNMYLYGGGKWSSPQDLDNKVREVKSSLDRQGLKFIPVGIADSTTNQPVLSGTSLAGVIGTNSGGIVGTNAGAIVGTNAGALTSGNSAPIIAMGGANIIAMGGANLNDLLRTSGTANVVAMGGANIIAMGGANAVSGGFRLQSADEKRPARVVSLGNGAVLLLPAKK